MGRTSKKQIDDVHFCTSSICCPFVLLPALGNIRNTVCSYPAAAGKKRQKKRGPHRSSPHVPHTPIPGRGFTGSGMAQ